MICSKCNTNNNDFSTFCINCGVRLIKETTTVCSNGHKYDSNLKQCPYCPSPDLQQRIKSGGYNEKTETFHSSKDMSKTKVMGIGKKDHTVIVSPEGKIPISEIQPGRRIIGWLVTFSHKSEGEDYKIYEGRNLIGGDSKADIILTDPAVSSPHCIILYRSGKIKIKDELSTNGTFINGKEIEESELNDGDLIKLGTTELLFRSIENNK